MSVETHQILTGSRGWIHDSWQSEYYPDDLPEDWRLGFYSNEFPVVLIPAEYLDSNDKSENVGERLEQWGEDIADEFRFLFEVAPDTLSNKEKFRTFISQIKALKSHCLGLIFIVDEKLAEDLTILKDNIHEAKNFTEVCIQYQGEDIPGPFRELLKAEEVSLTWNGEDNLELEDFLTGKLVVTIAAGEKMEPANLRRVLETGLKASTSDRVSVLIIDGNPPSLEVMRNAEVILGLL